MNGALWTVQWLLALTFLWSGGIKLFYDKYEVVAKKFGTVAPDRGLTTFIGIVELLGTAGLILPMAAKIDPLLTPLAALGLAVIMLLAIGYHIRAHEAILTQLILCVLAVFVAVGRFWHGF